MGGGLLELKSILFRKKSSEKKSTLSVGIIVIPTDNVH